MLSPKSIQKKFTSNNFTDVNDLNTSLQNLSQSITDLVHISYKLGRSKNNKTSYKKRVYTKTDMDNLIKNFKGNIRNILKTYTSLNTKKINDTTYKNNIEVTSLKIKQSQAKFNKGLDIFIQRLNRIGIDSQGSDDINHLKNFFIQKYKESNENKLQNISKRGVKKLSQTSLNKLFLLDKCHIVIDNFYSDFIEKINLGNFFYYCFNDIPAIKNDPKYYLNGHIKENHSEILKVYLPYISKDSHLKNVSNSTLSKLIDPTLLFFVINKFNLISYVFINSFIFHYLRLNQLETYKTKYIKIDETLKLFIELCYKLCNNTTKKSIFEEVVDINLQSKVKKENIINENGNTYIKKYQLNSLLKNFIINDDEKYKKQLIKDVSDDSIIDKGEDTLFFIRKAFF